ncbi:uncharacterized protein STEHIDRAFT_153306 [Stereum hirsutum FP-91666 SS1]|uniref:uncharacterized protein n=1 Tax=Stereum hirsutum (strain FP-91666) TaxID=721885 RepID=UPI000440D1AB|nr:uncharacterized protein STEHIDRAFT_153306 [Stereum hirsutum FP-91666 SS1]EIM91686.1 hypothetical protein STEHIDRAFT_153306 [Stereum hirsutum FP-91666 SS1]
MQVEANTRNTFPIHPPPPPNHGYIPAFGRSFMLVVRTTSGWSEVGAQSSSAKSAAPSDQDESVVCLYIELQSGLEALFHLLRAKFEDDGYEPRLLPIFPASSSTSPESGAEPSPHPSRIPTDLALSLVDTRIYFDDLTSPGSLHGFRRLPHTCSPNIDALYPVICAATHWYYHLRRRPADAKRSLTRTSIGESKGKVTLEMVVLEAGEGYHRSLNPLLFPVKSVEVGVNGGKDSSGGSPGKEKSLEDDTYDPETAGTYNRFLFMEVEADELTLYGQKIVNNSEYTLFPALFYFDNSEFSIAEYYLPPTATYTSSPDPPLIANGALTIGYGTSDLSPHVYFLLLNEDLDIG